VSPEVADVFIMIRRLHAIFLVAVGFIAITAFRMEFAKTGSPLLEDREAVLWALRAFLAILGVTGFAMVERIAHQSRKPEQSLHFRSVPAPIQQLATDAILRMAFYEALAVYGLLLVLVGGSWLDMICFACPAVALFLWKFPRRRVWVAALTLDNPPLASDRAGWGS
jgi:hypothetical protein